MNNCQCQERELLLQLPRSVDAVPCAQSGPDTGPAATLHLRASCALLPQHPAPSRTSSIMNTDTKWGRHVRTPPQPLRSVAAFWHMPGARPGLSPRPIETRTRARRPKVFSRCPPMALCHAMLWRAGSRALVAARPRSRRPGDRSRLHGRLAGWTCVCRACTRLWVGRRLLLVKRFFSFMPLPSLFRCFPCSSYL